MVSNQNREKVSLMSLAVETRFTIYDLLIQTSGTLVVFSNYELSRNVDLDTMNLLHVNQRVRAEVQDYFYKIQCFEFRSFPAMDNFVDKIGPYHASIIKKIQLGDWFARRGSFAEHIGSCLKHLPSLEFLTVLTKRYNPIKGFITGDPETNATLGDKAIAILAASPKLLAGRIYYVHDSFDGTKLCFVPPKVQYPPTVGKSIGGYSYGGPWATRYFEIPFSNDLEALQRLQNRGSSIDMPLSVPDSEDDRDA